MVPNMLFVCSMCDTKSDTVKKHAAHFRTHRHLSHKIQCGFMGCKNVFPTEASFQVHVARGHRRQVCHEALSASSSIDGNGQFHCPVISCGQRFLNSRKFNSHLRAHFDSGISIPCPHSGCNVKRSSWNSLTGHCTKFHRNSTALVSENECESVDPEQSDFFIPDESLTNVIKEEEAVSEGSCRSDELLKTVAEFYLKLAYKQLVPESTVQLIAEELRQLMCDNQSELLETLARSLQNNKVPLDIIADAVRSATYACNLPNVFHILRTDYMRKKTFQTMFPFVEPQPVGLEGNKFFYYVPMSETIKASFCNRAWVEYFIAPTPSSQDDVLRDFYDGQSFKNNAFFRDNPRAIKIILYQDGFELVCPIGAAKNKVHNVIAVYMAFGNLPSHIRFSRDSIQLVALCLKADFDQKLVYGKIVKDFLSMQVAGVDVPNYGNFKVGLLFIAGDNLGSHGLGGFLENFSRAIYFCRFCLLNRPLFFQTGGEVRQFKQRTVQSYNYALSKIHAGRESCMGVKTDSLFNQIAGFHVSSFGLPSCAGHDLAESVVAYDLVLFIRYFIEKGWFSLECLNEASEKFPYSVEDRRERAVKIKDLKKRKLVGSAWMVRNFLRLFPLIVFDYILDPNDRVWQCLLLLREITDIIVAPDIHKSHLPALQSKVEEYLVMRRELFPNVRLRPKHHYLSHYCEQVFQISPMTKSWTLRFESKHVHMKTAWRTGKNSINILKSISFKHEYLQSYARSGGNQQFDVVCENRSPLPTNVYSKLIIDAISKSGQLSNFEECTSVTVKQTKYAKGHVVITGQSNYGEVLDYGTIILILVDFNNSVKFLVKKGKATFRQFLGVFEMCADFVDRFECVGVDDLLSFYPLTPYVRDTFKFICLKHALVNSMHEFNV